MCDQEAEESCFTDATLEKEIRSMSPTQFDAINCITAGVVRQIIKEDPSKVVYAFRAYFRWATVMTIFLGKGGKDVVARLSGPERTIVLRLAALLPPMRLHEQTVLLRNFANAFAYALREPEERLTLHRITELLPNNLVAAHEAIRHYFRRLVAALAFIGESADLLALLLALFDDDERAVIKQYAEENWQFSAKERYWILREFVQEMLLPANESIMGKPEYVAQLTP